MHLQNITGWLYALSRLNPESYKRGVQPDSPQNAESARLRDKTELTVEYLAQRWIVCVSNAISDFLLSLTQV